jgi:hypothetical protein
MTDDAAALVDELVAARADFMAALDALAPARLSSARLVGDWSARELVAHLGYWAGHAVEVIHAVESGRADEAGADEPPVDDVNATVARVARMADLGTARKREAASVEALLERLATVDPALLSVSLPDGATLAQAVGQDGAEHYAEHAADLRSAAGDR